MLQTPRKSLPPQAPPGTDPRRFSVPGSTSTPTTGTPRSVSGSGDSSGIYSVGRDRPHIRSEDRVDITQYLEQIQRGNKISDTDAWNNKLIEYFDIATFTHQGHINYSQAAKALGGSTTLYKRRVEHLKNETNKVASGMGSETLLEDEREPSQDQAGNSNMEMQAARPRKRNKSDAKPILLPAKKLKLNDLNLTSTTDPLFRKTQVEYDKGDFKSLLLSTLSPDTAGKLSFEDVSLKSQVRERAASSVLEGNYIEVDLDNYANVLEENFSAYKIIPHLNELETAVKAEVRIPTGGDESVINDYTTEIMDTMDNQYNNDLDFGSIQGMDPIDLDVEQLESFSTGGGMTATEVMLLVKHVDDLRNPTKQIQNVRLRQLSDKTTAPKARKEKKDDGIDLSKDLRTLESKVFAKADPLKLMLDSSQLHPLNNLLESIDLREFTRLNLRPHYTAPTTAKAIREIMRGMITDNRPRNSDKDGNNVLGGDDDEADLADEAIDNADGPVLQDMLENAQNPEFDDAPSDHYSPALLSDLSDYDMPSDHPDEPQEPRTRSGNPMRILQRNVDVQQLKENIWHKIEHVDQDLPMVDIIRKTNRGYKEREKVDLVPPLYFLNLLHLANEKGIGLESTEDFSDVIVHPCHHETQTEGRAE